MRGFGNFRKKYLICDGNIDTIYLRVDDLKFISHYSFNSLHDHGLVGEYLFENYKFTKFQYLKYYEYQLVIKNKCKVSDLWEKYFGN
jgi:hypothetical protein